MTAGSEASLLIFGPRHVFGLPGGFSSLTPATLAPVFSFPALPFPLCPHSSVILQYRNLNLLSIDYAVKPRLRSRLTQGRSALPWKPWIFGRKDSHLTLATDLPRADQLYPGNLGYSAVRILTLLSLLIPAFSLLKRPHVLPVMLRPFKDAPLPMYLLHPSASVVCFSPGHFRRRASRLVSYYALFECMAASEPTS